MVCHRTRPVLKPCCWGAQFISWRTSMARRAPRCGRVAQRVSPTEPRRGHLSGSTSSFGCLRVFCCLLNQFLSGGCRSRHTQPYQSSPTSCKTATVQATVITLPLHCTTATLVCGWCIYPQGHPLTMSCATVRTIGSLSVCFQKGLAGSLGGSPTSHFGRGKTCT